MITVKDIREKEFGKQEHGYHEDEVDDFLDEIADQMEELIRENRALLNQIDELNAAAAKAPAQPEAPKAEVKPVVAAPEPQLDESSYFKNLEATLRETLLSAQRIADATVAEAREKAKGLISDAENQAKTLSADVTSAVERAKEELETLKKAHENYKGGFLSLVKNQMAAMGLDEHKLEDDDKK